jgi:chromosome segregation ATPase-like protein|nr:MAG TPA: chromosome segregation protein [Caudoviricetes sp.]
MADNKEQVILEVVIKNDAASKHIQENKKRIVELREEQALLNKTTKDGKDEYEAYAIEIKRLRTENVVWTKEIRNNNKAIKDQEGSLQSMRAELSRLNKVYVNLSQIERESAKGRDLQKKIKSLNEEIKTSEQKLGDYRRSVGGYEEAIKSAVNQTGIFSKIQGTLREVMSPFLALYKKVQLEIKTLTADYKLNSAATTQMSGAQKAAAISSNLLSTGLKILKIALISTGIGAIVVALGSLVAYLTKTQKGTELLSNVMAGLGAAINVIIDRVAKFGGTLVKVFSGDFKGAAQDMKATFAGIGDELQREIKLAYELNDISQQLEKQEVMLNMQRAAGRKEIERLKMISDDTTKSTKERIAAAKQASEIEQADMKQQIELGEKKLANLLGQKEVTQEVRDMLDAVSSGSMKADDAISKLGLSESTISDLREFSDLFQNVVDKQRDSYTKQIELQNKTNSITKESSKKALEIKKQQQAKELELSRQAEDAALSLVKEGIEKQRQTVNVQYDRQIEDLKRKLSTEKNLTDAAKKALNDSIILAEQKRDADLKKLSDESIQTQIKKETERIQLQLDSVKEGTSQEHNLRLSLIEHNRQAELAANLQLAEELRQSEADINAAYNKLVADENEAFRKEQFDKQSEYIRLEWENKILQLREGTLQEYDLKVQQAQADYDLLVNMDAATKAALYELDIEYTNAVLQSQKRITEAKQAQVNAENEFVLMQIEAATTVTDAFSSMIDTFAEDNENLAAFAKTVALFNIGLSTAEALAKGVASAQAVGFPANIPAIATTIAAIMANIVKAKQLVSKEKNPKYADGGEITGPSHASGGVLIEAEGGEGIINKHSMSNPLLRSIASAVNVAGGGIPFSNVPIFLPGSSGGFDTAELKAVFVEALKEMPAPIVSVVEFTEVQDRVKMIQNNSTI